MPTVGVGEAVFPVLTSELTVGNTRRERGPGGNHRSAFSAEVLSPSSRIQASFFYSVEKTGRGFAGHGLRPFGRISELRASADGFDKQILSRYQWPVHWYQPGQQQHRPTNDDFR